MNRAEQKLHKAVAEFLGYALGPDTWWTTFPAGGGGKVRGAILKGLGLKAGVPDILILHPNRAVWLELKAPKGRVSADQRECATRLWQVGARVYVCRSIDDVIEALAIERIPTRVAKTA